MNLTSASAQTRVQNSVNEAHRELCSSIGMPMTNRTVVTAMTTQNNRYMTWGPATTTPSVGVEKVIGISNPAFTPPLVLTENTYEQLFNEVVNTDPPQRWAMFNAAANSVTVFYDSQMTSASFQLTALVFANFATLSGSMTPLFAEDYHDALIYYACAIELDKKEKWDAAAKFEKRYEKRASELRYYYAKSAFLDIVQGANSQEDVYRTIPLA